MENYYQMKESEVKEIADDERLTVLRGRCWGSVVRETWSGLGGNTVLSFFLRRSCSGACLVVAGPPFSTIH